MKDTASLPARSPMMLSIARVLFPTDFSDNAQRALPLASEISIRNDAALHILHSVGFLPHQTDHPESLSPAMETLFEELVARSQRRFDDLEPSLPAGLEVEYVAERGFSPAEVILDYVIRRQVDVIVMGTHAGRGIRKLLLGSVAEEVVRLSPASVVTVPPGDVPADGVVSTIVVPVDFSDHSRTAVRCALALRDQFAANVHLLHVVHPLNYPDFYGVTMPVDPASEVTDSIRNAAVGAMRELLGSEDGDGAVVGTQVRVGQPADEIIDFAKTVEADLIVLPSHGQTGTPEVLIGSVTARVLRRARCPVLTLKVRGNSQIQSGNSSNAAEVAPEAAMTEGSG